MSMSSSKPQAWQLRKLLQGMVSDDQLADCQVAGLCLDSRKIQPGDLFLAVSGVAHDGRSFIRDAVAGGAAAIACEAGSGDDFTDMAVPIVALKDLRHRIGEIADRFYGSPSRQLLVIGVTGTNGKTTCVQLLAHCLDRPEARCGIIGTLGNGYPEMLKPATHTTPDALSLQGLLHDFVQQGAKAVCMEVSSHALEQHRVAAVTFDVAVFTNLTRDHLDYHGDMASYADSKASLFAMPGLRYAVINRDDEFGRSLIDRLKGDKTAPEVVSYGLHEGDVRSSSIQAQRSGLALALITSQGKCDLHSHLIGHFNASNLLAVLAVLLVCGMELRGAVAALGQAKPVTGRLELFGGSQAKPLVVVDYAHTPDALEQALLALREHTQGQLWCIFGCGGDRDRGKRPLMGAVAQRLANKIVLTDDNPRNEDPNKIINDIIEGLQDRPIVMRDRTMAIRYAIDKADIDDTILVAGKGHEDYQQVGDERLPYSDRITVQQILGEAA